MDFHNLKRKELQALCKRHNIPANLTNVEMANQLTTLLKGKEERRLTNGRSCRKGGEEDSGNEDEPDIVNKKTKKVRFSPENEMFEFVKSDIRYTQVSRGTRQKSVLSRVSLADAVLENSNVDNGGLKQSNRDGMGVTSKGKEYSKGHMDIVGTVETRRVTWSRVKELVATGAEMKQGQGKKGQNGGERMGIVPVEDKFGEADSKGRLDIVGTLEARRLTRSRAKVLVAAGVEEKQRQGKKGQNGGKGKGIAVVEDTAEIGKAYDSDGRVNIERSLIRKGMVIENKSENVSVDKGCKSGKRKNIDQRIGLEGEQVLKKKKALEEKVEIQKELRRSKRNEKTSDEDSEMLNVNFSETEVVRKEQPRKMKKTVVLENPEVGDEGSFKAVSQLGEPDNDPCRNTRLQKSMVLALKQRNDAEEMSGMIPEVQKPSNVPLRRSPRGKSLVPALEQRKDDAEERSEMATEVREPFNVQLRRSTRGRPAAPLLQQRKDDVEGRSQMSPKVQEPFKAPLRRSHRGKLSHEIEGNNKLESKGTDKIVPQQPTENVLSRRVNRGKRGGLSYDKSVIKEDNFQPEELPEVPLRRSTRQKLMQPLVEKPINNFGTGKQSLKSEVGPQVEDKRVSEPSASIMCSEHESALPKSDTTRTERIENKKVLKLSGEASEGKGNMQAGDNLRRSKRISSGHESSSSKVETHVPRKEEVGKKRKHQNVEEKAAETRGAGNREGRKQRRDQSVEKVAATRANIASSKSPKCRVQHEEPTALNNLFTGARKKDFLIRGSSYNGNVEAAVPITFNPAVSNTEEVLDNSVAVSSNSLVGTFEDSLAKEIGDVETSGRDSHQQSQKDFCGAVGDPSAEEDKSMEMVDLEKDCCSDVQSLHAGLEIAKSEIDKENTINLPESNCGELLERYTDKVNKEKQEFQPSSNNRGIICNDLASMQGAESAEAASGVNDHSLIDEPDFVARLEVPKTVDEPSRSKSPVVVHRFDEDKVDFATKESLVEPESTQRSGFSVISDNTVINCGGDLETGFEKNVEADTEDEDGKELASADCGNEKIGTYVAKELEHGPQDIGKFAVSVRDDSFFESPLGSCHRMGFGESFENAVHGNAEAGGSVSHGRSSVARVMPDVQEKASDEDCGNLKEPRVGVRTETVNTSELPQSDHSVEFTETKDFEKPLGQIEQCCRNIDNEADKSGPGDELLHYEDQVHEVGNPNVISDEYEVPRACDSVGRTSTGVSKPNVCGQFLEAAVMLKTAFDSDYGKLSRGKLTELESGSSSLSFLHRSPSKAVQVDQDIEVAPRPNNMVEKVHSPLTIVQKQEIGVGSDGGKHRMEVSQMKSVVKNDCIEGRNVCSDNYNSEDAECLLLTENTSCGVSALICQVKNKENHETCTAERSQLNIEDYHPSPKGEDFRKLFTTPLGSSKIIKDKDGEQLGRSNCHATTPESLKIINEHEGSHAPLNDSISSGIGKCGVPGVCYYPDQTSSDLPRSVDFEASQEAVGMQKTTDVKLSQGNSTEVEFGSNGFSSKHMQLPEAVSDDEDNEVPPRPGHMVEEVSSSFNEVHKKEIEMRSDGGMHSRDASQLRTKVQNEACEGNNASVNNDERIEDANSSLLPETPGEVTENKERNEICTMEGSQFDSAKCNTSGRSLLAANLEGDQRINLFSTPHFLSEFNAMEENISTKCDRTGKSLATEKIGEGGGRFESNEASTKGTKDIAPASDDVLHSIPAPSDDYIGGDDQGEQFRKLFATPLGRSKMITEKEGEQLGDMIARTPIVALKAAEGKSNFPATPLISSKSAKETEVSCLPLNDSVSFAFFNHGAVIDSLRQTLSQLPKPKVSSPSLEAADKLRPDFVAADVNLNSNQRKELTSGSFSSMHMQAPKAFSDDQALMPRMDEKVDSPSREVQLETGMGSERQRHSMGSQTRTATQNNVCEGRNVCGDTYKTMEDADSHLLSETTFHNISASTLEVPMEKGRHDICASKGSQMFIFDENNIVGFPPSTTPEGDQLRNLFASPHSPPNFSFLMGNFSTNCDETGDELVRERSICLEEYGGSCEANEDSINEEKDMAPLVADAVADPVPSTPHEDIGFNEKGEELGKLHATPLGSSKIEGQQGEQLLSTSPTVGVAQSNQKTADFSRESEMAKEALIK